MRSSYLPHATLAALLMAALLTVLAGGRMAREERVVRTEVGREEIGELSSEMMGQLGRLDQLYTDHLRKLARTDTKDRFALRNACERIVGLRQIAAAVDVESAARAEAFQLNLESAYRGVPMLPGQAKPSLGGDLYELPADALASAPDDHGWLEQPGQPAMFWHRRAPGVYVVITPDPEAVRAALHGWLEEWIPEVIEPVDASGAQVRIAGERGDLFETMATPDHDQVAADVVVPLRARFGNWKVAAWDDRIVDVSHHVPTLAISTGLAAMFVLLGLGAFVILRRALRLSEQRVSFVNRVSHELRTPLTNILLNNDLAVDAVELGDEVAAAGRLELIRDEAGRLSRLIANVLTFSRSGDESEAVGREVFSLASCVERTLAPFRASLERKGVGVDIEVDESLQALGDVDLTAQVLANLISNVEKYASEGGQLKIVGGIDEAAGRAPATTLRVSDCGAGIPESARERIFEPFVRLSERVDEGVSGTGLGLSIARELAQKMGGELRLLESKSGAEFELRLPVAPANIVEMEGRKIS